MEDVASRWPRRETILRTIVIFGIAGVLLIKVVRFVENTPERAQEEANLQALQKSEAAQKAFFDARAAQEEAALQAAKALVVPGVSEQNMGQVANSIVGAEGDIRWETGEAAEKESQDKGLIIVSAHLLPKGGCKGLLQFLYNPGTRVVELKGVFDEKSGHGFTIGNPEIFREVLGGLRDGTNPWVAFRGKDAKLLCSEENSASQGNEQNVERTPKGG